MRKTRLEGRRRLTPTNVLVTVALFVALGGTSYAAIQVTGRNIKDNTVTSADIKNGGLRSTDFGNGLLDSAKAIPLNSFGIEAARTSGPAGVPANPNYTTIATLNGVQPGAYVIMAKTDIQSDQLDASRCRLQAEGATDESNRGIRSNGTPEAQNMQLAHTFSAPGSIVLSCRSTDGNWTAADSKILAVKIDSAQEKAVSG